MKLKKILVIIFVTLLAVVLSACGKTDDEKAKSYLDEIMITYATGDSATNVNNNITLQTVETEGVTVTWESDNTAVISNTGVVNKLTTDTVVNMKVTVKYNEVSVDKSFALTVKAKEIFTIAEAHATEIDDTTEVSTQGTIVGTYGRGFLLKDDTGYILVYLNKTPENEIGDYIAIKGVLSKYNEKNQYTATSIITELSSGKDYEINSTTLDATAADAFITSDTFDYGKKVTVKAIVTSVSSNYVNMLIEGSSNGLCIAYSNDSSVYIVGKEYIVTGFALYTSTYKEVTSLYVMEYGSGVEDTTYPSRNVIALIEKIGTVTYTSDSKGLIEKAKTAYDTLSEEEKALVTNYTTLTEAESTYLVLETIANITAIGTVSLTEPCKELIDKAKASYEALSEEEKALVTNYSVLTQADADYNALYDASLVTKYTLTVSEKSKTYISLNTTETEVNGGTEVEITVTPIDNSEIVLMVNNTAVELIENKAKITIISNTTISLNAKSILYSTGFETTNGWKKNIYISGNNKYNGGLKEYTTKVTDTETTAHTFSVTNFDCISNTSLSDAQLMAGRNYKSVATLATDAERSLATKFTLENVTSVSFEAIISNNNSTVTAKLYSSLNGTTWTEVGTAVTLTNEKDLYTFNVTTTGEQYFKLLFICEKTPSSNQDIRFDNLVFYKSETL